MIERNPGCREGSACAGKICCSCVARPVAAGETSASGGLVEEPPTRRGRIHDLRIRDFTEQPLRGVREEMWARHKSFDRNLVVIGAGSAGLVSALIAATVKAKVTLIEANEMGEIKHIVMHSDVIFLKHISIRTNHIQICEMY